MNFVKVTLVMVNYSFDFQDYSLTLFALVVYGSSYTTRTHGIIVKYILIVYISINIDNT
jgi:hypothetical protein